MWLAVRPHISFSPCLETQDMELNWKSHYFMKFSKQTSFMAKLTDSLMSYIEEL